MPIFLIIIALFVPRLVIALLWFFTNWMSVPYAHIILPILGFIFMPYTLLWYASVEHWFGGEWNGFWQIAILIVAILLDLSPSKWARSE